MIKICEEFAKEYQLTFNSNKSYCIQFGDRPVGNKAVFMNGEPMEWVSEVKHLGNILSSNLSDNKAYRPNAHLLYIVMHYNVNIMVIMVLYNFTLLFQPLEQTLITQTQV